VLAYSPFSAYPFVMKPTYDPIVTYVAAKLSKQQGRTVTPAQVLLKWNMQRGIASIPRSSSPAHLLSNIQAAEMPALSVEHMQLLDALQHLVASPVCQPVDLD
jgi:alcohol dehydrogenase (NADP+)